MAGWAILTGRGSDAYARRVVAARAWPISGSTLVGRGAEVDALVAALAAGERLVTLTGPPGVGKTRLAAAVAEAVADGYDEVGWVDLAPVSDPDRVLDEIAQAAGVRTTAALADRELLLVLDNFEHLLPAAATVGNLVSSLPGLQLLVTSRERLRLRAEREQPVAPLPMPGPDDLADLGRLAANPAVALVLDRAPAYLAVTPRTAQSLVDICVQLDGLPLALEFAAARLRVFTPGELAFRLGHRMRELAGAPRDAPDRHRDLRSAIEWSHDLLPETERALFRRLSVFTGGWSVAAAEAVCVGPELPDVTAALESLLDKSLVRRTGEDGAGATFSMLLSLREYAAEELAERGEEDAVRSRHAAWFAGLAREFEATIGTPEENLTWDRMVAARADIEAASRYAAGRGDRADPDPEHWLSAAAGWFWYIRGSPKSARHLLERAEQVDRDSSPESWCAALVVTGVVAFALGDLDRADRALLASLALSEPRGDRRRLAMATAFRGHVARERGDLDAAEAHYRTARRVFEELDNPRGTAWARTDLGLLLSQRGDLDAAEGELRAAVSTFETLDYPWAVAVSACGLGGVLADAGRADEAGPLLGRALRLHEDVGDRRGTAQCLEALADVALARSSHATAARLLGAAAGRRAAVAAHATEAEQARMARVSTTAARALGAAAFEHELAAGRGAPGPVSLALAARVAGPAGDDDRPAAGILTARQLEVAALVATGRTNRQIARDLGISEKTAELHVRNTMQRLGMHNRAAVAAWVGAQGLPETPH